MHRFLGLGFFVVVLGLGWYFSPEVATKVRMWQFSDSATKDELLSEEFIERITASTGEIEPKADRGVWFNREIIVPQEMLAMKAEPGETRVLGESSGRKWIEIDLTNQMLYAHEGGSIVYAFPVSTGLPWFSTVTGNFYVWAKVRAQRMSGGSVADGTFYDLPNVQFVQYFHGGYGIHGAYWHNDFGKPRSHGCVNMRNGDAEALYYWSDPQLPVGVTYRAGIKPEESTSVVVHGVTPTRLD